MPRAVRYAAVYLGSSMISLRTEVEMIGLDFGELTAKPSAAALSETETMI
jgi:hypothetical protein